MGTQLVTPPSLEPVSLDEAKDHLRVDQEDDDAYITGLVAAARQMVEADTRRALLTQDWQLTVADIWPGESYMDVTRAVQARYPYGSNVFRTPRKFVVLTRPPVQSIISVNYLASDFSTVVLDPSQYRISKLDTGEYAMRPVPGVTWPELISDPEAATIVIRCGYGDKPGSIPEPLRIAMLLLCGQWYDQRMPLNLVVRGTVEELPNAVKDLVFRYRVFY